MYCAILWHLCMYHKKIVLFKLTLYSNKMCTGECNFNKSKQYWKLVYEMLLRHDYLAYRMFGLGSYDKISFSDITENIYPHFHYRYKACYIHLTRVKAAKIRSTSSWKSRHTVINNQVATVIWQVGFAWLCMP